MYYRFKDITKDLEALDKQYSLGEKNIKVLNILPREWETKDTNIEEAKNLNTILIESIVNSPTTYELKLKSKV